MNWIPRSLRHITQDYSDSGNDSVQLRFTELASMWIIDIRYSLNIIHKIDDRYWILDASLKGGRAPPLRPWLNWIEQRTTDPQIRRSSRLGRMRILLAFVV